MRVCTWVLAAAMLAAPPVMAEEGAKPASDAAKPAVNVNAPRPAMSTEKLVALRNALAAQVAVYDAVEQTWRKPTDSEQQQLSQNAPVSGDARVVTLSNGAVAIQGAAAEISFLTVEMQPDGEMTMGHVARSEASSLAKVPTPRLKTAPSASGGKDVE